MKAVCLGGCVHVWDEKSKRFVKTTQSSLRAAGLDKKHLGLTKAQMKAAL